MARPARGCAKTQAFIERVESPSRFRQSENQKFWWCYREKAIKKNHSPHSWLAHVFTQAAPTAADLRTIPDGPPSTLSRPQRVQSNAHRCPSPADALSKS